MIRRDDKKLTLLDSVIEAVAPQWAVRRAQARTVLALSSQYRGADTPRTRANWILPGLFDKSTPDPYDLSILRTRTRHQNRNDPIAAGATDTLKINIVGNGLTPQSRIRSDYIGISEEKSKTLQKQAELAWDKFCPFADSANTLTMDEIQFLAIAKIIEDGEIIAIPTWADEPWRPFGRCIELHESERLTAPLSALTASKNLKHGIEFGSRGEPVKYWIKKANADKYIKIPARDTQGRPKILHIFPTKRPGQVRGIPFFAPVLTYFKDLADYMEAEVVAARVAACLAVFITKEDPMGGAYAMGSEIEAVTNARIQALEPAQVSYLNTGEAINVVDPKRPGDAFGPFTEVILRMIGVGIGMPYELLVKDFSKTNYSSARASLLEGRRMFLNWRKWFAQKFCQPMWELVIEEAYLRDEFEAPEFEKYKHEYTRANWIGGGWGFVDPVKETDAAIKRIDYNLSTYAEEVAAQGGDWEETFEQRKREQDKEKDLGLEVKKDDKKTGDQEKDQDGEEK